MKPRRRTSRRLTDRAFAESLQRIRLDAIARGEAEPICPREQYFQWTLKSRGRADPADYIVPWPLLVAEGELIRMEREAATRADSTSNDDTGAFGSIGSFSPLSPDPA